MVSLICLFFARKVRVSDLHVVNLNAIVPSPGAALCSFVRTAAAAVCTGKCDLFMAINKQIPVQTDRDLILFAEPAFSDGHPGG